MATTAVGTIGQGEQDARKPAATRALYRPVDVGHSDQSDLHTPCAPLGDLGTHRLRAIADLLHDKFVFPWCEGRHEELAVGARPVPGYFGGR